MLKHTRRTFALTLLTTVLTGCVDNAVGQNRERDGSVVQGSSGINLNLHKYRASDEGVLALEADLGNNSAKDICVAPNTANTLQVNIIDATTGFFVFAQDEEIGLDPQASSDTVGASRSYYNRPVKVASFDSAVLSVNLSPLVGAYLVDSQNVGTGRPVSAEGLLVQLELPVFDCSFPSLNEALLSGRHVIVKSETFEIQGNVRAFLRPC